MKYSLSILRLFVGIVTVVSGVASRGGDRTSPSDKLLLVTAAAEVRLSGTSTLGRWTCHGTELRAVAEIAENVETWEKIVHAILRDRPLPLPAPRLDIRARFTVDTLKCGSARMKRDLLEAVRSDKYPDVFYSVTALQNPRRRGEDGHGARMYETEVAGDLTLAGITRATTHKAHVRIRDPHTFEVEGLIALTMGDFGIDPPVALLGLLRAHEAFSVSYRIRARLDETGAATYRPDPVELAEAEP